MRLKPPPYPRLLVSLHRPPITRLLRQKYKRHHKRHRHALKLLGVKKATKQRAQGYRLQATIIEYFYRVLTKDKANNNLQFQQSLSTQKAQWSLIQTWYSSRYNREGVKKIQKRKKLSIFTIRSDN